MKTKRAGEPNRLDMQEAFQRRSSSSASSTSPKPAFSLSSSSHSSTLIRRGVGFVAAAKVKLISVGAYRLLRVKKSCASAGEWDAFAQNAGASFRCAYHAARAWQLEHHLIYRLLRFEVFDNDGGAERKIAQCAIGVGRRWRVFADSLQIAPEHRERWTEIMTAVVEVCGPGRYVYGSDWSLEPSREADLLGIRAVSPSLQVYRTNLQLVDFRDWPSWDVYYRSLSKNVRRNVAKSEKMTGSIPILTRPNLQHALWLYEVRYATYRRKHLSKGFGVRLVRSLLRSAALLRFCEVGLIRWNKITLAGYGGVRFGANTFFLEGGSATVNHGASWRLITCVMERAWRDSEGQGRFVLGSDDGSQAGSKEWDGLARSRAACRAKPVPISVIRFSYEPGAKAEPYPRCDAPTRSPIAVREPSSAK